jgi:hypothetical protein
MRGETVPVCWAVSVARNAICKVGGFENLGEGCAGYALDHGARDATPFSVKHPGWAAVLLGIFKAFFGRMLIRKKRRTRLSRRGNFAIISL